MDSWAHIHVYNGMPADKKSAVLKVLDEFQQDLKLLADENDKKNGSGARPVIFQQFNPKFLECSVSI